MHWQDDDVADILRQSKTIAVVGLSNDRFRPSYGVARYLQQEGYEIFPVNPNETEVLGAPAASRLADLRVPVDVVDVFRRPQHAMDVVEQAIAIGARSVWLQPGTGTEEAAQRARRAGLKVVLNRCMATEARRLHGALAE
jgi:uncharacterized protein